MELPYLQLNFLAFEGSGSLLSKGIPLGPFRLMLASLPTNTVLQPGIPVEQQALSMASALLLPVLATYRQGGGKGRIAGRQPHKVQNLKANKVDGQREYHDDGLVE